MTVEIGSASTGLGRWKPNLKFVDMRTLTSDPVEAYERAGGVPALVNIPLAKILNLGPLAFFVTENSGDPYIETARDVVAGRCDSYERSPLAWFYARWKPENATVLLGLAGAAAPRPLLEAPPSGAVYPWDSYTPAEMSEKKFSDILRENRKHGVDLPATEGFKWWGPISRRKGQLEFDRLRMVIDSVRQHGYQDILGSPGGFLMMRGKEWRLLGTGGDHRRAARVALGWTDMPMRLRNTMIRREEALSWTNVRSGLYTEAQALTVFDRMFEGRQPQGCPVFG